MPHDVHGTTTPPRRISSPELERSLALHHSAGQAPTAAHLALPHLLDAHTSHGFTHFLDIVTDDLPPGHFRVLAAYRLHAGLTADEIDHASLYDRYPNLPVHCDNPISRFLLDSAQHGQRPSPHVFTSSLDPACPLLAPFLAPTVAHGQPFSVVAVPVFCSGRAAWALFIAPGHLHPTDELVLGLVHSSNFVSTAAEARSMAERITALYTGLALKIDELARAQRSLIPAHAPALPGIQLHTAYRPCDAGGGDYFDHHLFPDGRLGIMIADVSGHGPAAAVGMAILRTVLHTSTWLGRDPVASVRDVNAVLCQLLTEGMFVTAFFLLLDTRSGRYRTINCGHPPPRYLSAGHEPRPLPGDACLPLGITHPLDTAGGEGTLHPGDALLFYTDGVVEARDQHARFLGTQPLDDALRAHPTHPDRALDHALRQLHHHAGHAPAADDVCLVALRWTPEP